MTIKLHTGKLHTGNIHRGNIRKGKLHRGKIYTGELVRLNTLHRYQILDTPPESAFDDLVQLAVQIRERPIAAITFVDERRQWFKSCDGLSIHETNRPFAFCDHTIRSATPFNVPDASLDSRFAGDRLPGEPSYVSITASR